MSRLPGRFRRAVPEGLSGQGRSRRGMYAMAGWIRPFPSRPRYQPSAILEAWTWTSCVSGSNVAPRTAVA